MNNMTLSALRNAYLKQKLSPAELLRRIRERSAQYADHNIWIYQLSDTELQPYIHALADKPIDSTPLWGIPFAIKDNIDLAGVPTTAGCTAFTYTPTQSAQVVQQLIDAGAIPVGKTNLDQFATGLNGTRSPWGACRNAFNPDYISGGSSSGSAVAVALGLATFSLGTDTAGSGRVPACFNNLIGLKPTRGLLSATGLVPACRSLDCISIFALDSIDANVVLQCAEGEDASDGYSRTNPYRNQARHFGCRDGGMTLGVIPNAQLKFFGDQGYIDAYARTIEQLSAAGIELKEIDYEPFNEAAKLLYEGPWVAERYLAIEHLVKSKPETLLPVIRAIIEPGGEPRATDLFKAQYRLEALKKQCLAQLESLDALLTPTAGRLFTIDEVLAEPIQRNSELGYYTNFMNLFDLASVALPTTFTEQGLPFGITLASTAFSDRALLSIANRIQRILPLPSGVDNSPLTQLPAPPVENSNTVDIAVCGAHLDGLPLNWQLIERGGVLLARTTTSKAYRMYALPDGPPNRPGLIRDKQLGAEIEVEVWRLPTREFGSFVANIPAPLGIGKVELIDGRLVSGFICEPYAVHDAQEITHMGSWRRYMSESHNE